MFLSLTNYSRGYFLLCSPSINFAFSKYPAFSIVPKALQLIPNLLLISLFDSFGCIWAIRFLFAFANSINAFMGLRILAEAGADGGTGNIKRCLMGMRGNGVRNGTDEFVKGSCWWTCGDIGVFRWICLSDGVSVEF